MGDDGADGGVSGAAGTVGGRAGEERGAALNFGWRVTRRDGESFVGWVVTHSTLPRESREPKSDLTHGAQPGASVHPITPSFRS